MGTMLSCEECTTATTSSVINLSDPLVLRLVDGIELPTTEAKSSTPEDYWMEKLECIEDSHSTAYGMKYKTINEFVIEMEKRIRLGMAVHPCSYSFLAKCYKRFPECTLQCSKEVRQFVECLDQKRFEKLQKILKEYRAAEAEKLKYTKKKPTSCSAVK